MIHGKYKVKSKGVKIRETRSEMKTGGREGDVESD